MFVSALNWGRKSACVSVCVCKADQADQLALSDNQEIKWAKERKRRGGEERHSTKGVSPSADGAALPRCGCGIDVCASYRFGELAIT